MLAEISGWGRLWHGKDMILNREIFWLVELTHGVNPFTGSERMKMQNCASIGKLHCLLPRNVRGSKRPRSSVEETTPELHVLPAGLEVNRQPSASKEHTRMEERLMGHMGEARGLACIVIVQYMGVQGRETVLVLRVERERVSDS